MRGLFFDFSMEARMPAQVIPTIENFNDFVEKMTKLGFRVISGTEFKREARRLELRAPRPVEGRETGLSYYANRILVVVWTTWMAEGQTIKKKDSGWVVVKQDYDKKPVYIDGPFHRTENFLLTLYQNAWLAHFRATNRPLCSKCRQFLRIRRGKYFKSRFWSCGCINYHDDKKPFHLDWDYGLPERAKIFLRRKRKTSAKWLEKIRELGREPYSAIKKRKPWVVGRPENLP